MLEAGIRYPADFYVGQIFYYTTTRQLSVGEGIWNAHVSFFA